MIGFFVFLAELVLDGFSSLDGSTQSSPSSSPITDGYQLPTLANVPSPQSSAAFTVLNAPAVQFQQQQSVNPPGLLANLQNKVTSQQIFQNNPPNLTPLPATAFQRKLVGGGKALTLQ